MNKTEQKIMYIIQQRESCFLKGFDWTKIITKEEQKRADRKPINYVAVWKTGKTRWDDAINKLVNKDVLIENSATMGNPFYIRNGGYLERE